MSSYRVVKTGLLGLLRPEYAGPFMEALEGVIHNHHKAFIEALLLLNLFVNDRAGAVGAEMPQINQTLVYQASCFNGVPPAASASGSNSIGWMAMRRRRCRMRYSSVSGSTGQRVPAHSKSVSEATDRSGDEQGRCSPTAGSFTSRSSPAQEAWSLTIRTML